MYEEVDEVGEECKEEEVVDFSSSEATCWGRHFKLVNLCGIDIADTKL